MDFKLDNVSTTSFGLHLNPNFSIGSPGVKANKVPIPFSHGVLDLTEVNGLNYENRSISFTLEKLRPKDQWYATYNNFMIRFHGKKVKIVPPYDTTHYFMGRINVGALQRGDYMSFQVTCDCEPFRYKEGLTTYTYGLSSTAAIKYLTNTGLPVVPTFVVSSNATIVYGANTYTLSAGTHTLPIILNLGSNTLRVSGSGNLTVRYQERML